MWTSLKDIRKDVFRCFLAFKTKLLCSVATGAYRGNKAGFEGDQGEDHFASAGISGPPECEDGSGD